MARHVLKIPMPVHLLHVSDENDFSLGFVQCLYYSAYSYVLLSIEFVCKY